MLKRVYINQNLDEVRVIYCGLTVKDTDVLIKGFWLESRQEIELIIQF